MVARLIDPACCHRTAPCPPQLGEGMTGSRTNPALPQRICAITLGEGTPQPHNLAADLPASADSMHRAGPASRPFVLATLRALRLDPGPYPVLPTRRPKTSKTTGRQPLDRPRPFRDDSAVRIGRPGPEAASGCVGHGAESRTRHRRRERERSRDFAVVVSVTDGTIAQWRWTRGGDI